MSREVFQSNKIILFLVVGVIYGAVIYGYLKTVFPLFVLPIVFVIGLFIIFSSLKTKLIVEEGMLKYEKLFGGEEVELKKVSHIIIRQVDTRFNDSTNQTVFHENDSSPKPENTIKIGKVSVTGVQSANSDGKIEKIMYIQDESGRTIFSLPANTVRFTQRDKFREAIHRENPNIEMF